MSTKRNFYEILKTTQTASIEELRRNYKQLILQHHPDKLQHDIVDDFETTTAKTTASATVNDAQTTADLSAATVDPNLEISKSTTSSTATTDHSTLSVEFVAINEAWHTLKDPTKRRLYDAQLLLTKFQAQHNIFARLKLADMKRCAAKADPIATTATTTTTNSDCDCTSNTNDNGSGSDVDNVGCKSHGDRNEGFNCPVKEAECAEEEEEEGNECGTHCYYYYTYDCRCGGQYIVDESADSEILNRKCKRTAATATTTATSHQRVENDDAAKEQQQQQNTQQNQINRCDTDSDKNSAAAVSVSASADGVDEAAEDVEEENDEEGEEVLVECSECSLVIVLS